MQARRALTVYCRYRWGTSRVCLCSAVHESDMEQQGFVQGVPVEVHSSSFANMCWFLMVSHQAARRIVDAQDGEMSCMQSGKTSEAPACPHATAQVLGGGLNPKP
jgi:hypothetical protein